MFHQNIDGVAFCGAVKYTSDKDFSWDYSSSPRPCHNLAFLLEGEGKIVSDDTTITVKKGDILYIPQNSLYAVTWKADPHCVFHSVHFNFSPRQNPFANKKVPVQLLPNDEFAELYKLVQTMQEYQYAKPPVAFLHLSAFYCLCGRLLPKVKMQKNDLRKSNIYPALVYMENHSTQSCSIEQLASLCYLSPSRFYYLFKKQVGCTPITHKNKITVQKIAQALLLEKDKSIDTIAREHGFVSTIYCTRLFKKMTGKTPSQFRKEGTFM